ncbi:hypothetical protein [Streptomyces sp. NBC_01353]|uniref:hypothetical protein n=1 Tax=Streptomyces sp. NBC_01353 TaxID=2903835 RepID=UPI002E36EA8C|nr:hypothetical protein [Streptomyces sp. NBC_01353]
MNKRTGVAVAMAAAAAALITGCGAGTATDTPGTTPVAENKPMVNKENWPKATPERGLAKGLSLPLEAYMQTYQDTVTLDQASRKLQEKCMADYGFSIELPLAGTTPPPNDNDANMERRYGLTDREAAARYGYGLPEALTNQVRQKMPELTDEQVQVLIGHSKPTKPTAPGAAPAAEPAPESYKGKKIHEGGCSGWAKDRLKQPTPEGLAFVSELNGNSFTESMRVPAVKQAMASWSQCMKAEGYAAATPFEATEIAPHAEGGTASKEEIAVALAEIDCKKKTDLVAVWFTEESKIQKAQIAEHQGRLNGARTQNSSAVAVADAELAG